MNLDRSLYLQIAPRLEESLIQYEACWTSGQAPELSEWYVRTLDRMYELRDLKQVKQQILFEFLAIDFEYRTRNQGERESLQTPLDLEQMDLVRDVFGSRADWPDELVAEEYRMHRRTQALPATSRSSKIRDFVAVSRSSCLLRVDLELARETKSVPHRFVALPRDSRATLDARDFTIKSHLGSGGMGKVYMAWSSILGRHVAIKFLRKDLLRDPRAIEQFVEEAVVLSQLRHPGIIGIHGLGQSKHGSYFLVTDLILNGDLSQLMSRLLIDDMQVVRWGVEIATALELVHANKIIHCDLKPANLLLKEDGSIVITDFGLAVRISNETATSVGGTRVYMAPEQINPQLGEIGPWTDIYSVGQVLKRLRCQGKRSSELPYTRGIGEELSNVIDNCSQLDPLDRYRSMAELKAALVKVR